MLPGGNDEYEELRSSPPSSCMFALYRVVALANSVRAVASFSCSLLATRSSLLVFVGGIKVCWRSGAGEAGYDDDDENEFHY